MVVLVGKVKIERRIKGSERINPSRYLGEAFLGRGEQYGQRSSATPESSWNVPVIATTRDVMWLERTQ